MTDTRIQASLRQKIHLLVDSGHEDKLNIWHHVKTYPPEEWLKAEIEARKAHNALVPPNNDEIFVEEVAK